MSRDAMQSARAFARDYAAPNAAQWEQGGDAPREAFGEAARAGLTGVMVPEESGGLGLGFVEAASILEELAAANAAFAFALCVHNNVANANAIARHGSAAQAGELLPGLLAGERIGAFCLTEPDKGSDAAAITTLASRAPGGWTLTGAKAWVTNGVHADVLLVYAQTESGSGAAGIAAFLVDAAGANLKRSEPYPLAGSSAFGLAEIAFNDCTIGKDRLFVPAGEGLRAAMRGINQARAFVGAVCNGMLASSLETALKYTAGREAFGKKVLEFQGIQWSLADVATELEASRLLTRKALEALDRGEAAIIEAAHAKKFASHAAFEGIAACQQAMGAAGLLPAYPLARHLSVARTMQIVDGTTEIQNVVISRMLAREYGLDTG